jgi:hypothetical protein
VGTFSQETLVEMIGTTRSRVSFFMNKLSAVTQMLPRRERNHQPWRDAGASLRTALALETLVHLVAGIDANRQHADLSSGEARTRSSQKYQMQEHYWIDRCP